MGVGIPLETMPYHSYCLKIYLHGQKIADHQTDIHIKNSVVRLIWQTYLAKSFVLRAFFSIFYSITYESEIIRLQISTDWRSSELLLHYSFVFSNKVRLQNVLSPYPYMLCESMFKSKLLKHDKGTPKTTKRGYYKNQRISHRVTSEVEDCIPSSWVK